MENKLANQAITEQQCICSSVCKPTSPADGPNQVESLIAGTEGKTNLNILDILDALPFYVLLIDADHNIIEANSAVYTQLGVKREDILGKYCPRIIHGLDEPFHGCPLEEAATKNTAIEREVYDPKTRRWIRSAIYPTRAFTENKKRIFFHMVTDITEVKEAQEHLKTSHETLRRLSAHLESVREEEKKKIARDLHDETSQVLASLYAHLETAVATLPPEAEKSREILKKAQSLSTTILDEIHNLIYELRPSLLDELGLIAAVNSLIENYLKVAGLKVSFRTTGKIKRLAPSLEILLFRVIQESFTNIVKHAHARNVKVNVYFKRGSVKVHIKDDGAGFDIQHVLNSGGKVPGLGLIGMRERVELFNGSLAIDSNPEHGTEITIEVPLNGEGQNG